MKNVAFVGCMFACLLYTCAALADAVLVQHVEIKMFTASIPDDEPRVEAEDRRQEYDRCLRLADGKVKVEHSGQYQILRSDKEFVWVGVLNAVTADRWSYEYIRGIKEDEVKRQTRLLEIYKEMRNPAEESKILVAEDDLAWAGQFADEVAVTLEATGESKDILGHKCQRYRIMAGSREAYDGWLATDIPVTKAQAEALADLRDYAIGPWGESENEIRGGFPKPVIDRMKDLTHLPLEETLTPWRGGLAPKVHITAKAVSIEEVPADQFELPPGVSEITLGEHATFEEALPIFE